MAQRFTVRVRRGIDKVVELAEQQIRADEMQNGGSTMNADLRRDVQAALQWMKENGEQQSLPLRK